MSGELIEILSPPWYSQTSPGVTPAFMFSDNGVISTGKWLKVGLVPSNSTAYPIFGKNSIDKISFACKNVISSDATMQIYQRTGENTYIEIVGASITLSAGNYFAVVEFSPRISLPENPQLAVYHASGGSVTDPIVSMFLMPRL